jgi:chromate transporter
VAALGLMAAVTVQLARAAVVDIWTAGLALLSAVLLIRWRLNATWLIGLGGFAGLLKWFLG